MSIISAKDLDLESINTIFSYANKYKNKEYDDILNKKIVGLIFLEPSSRTQMSFEAAVKLLGGNTLILNIDNSSLKKKESLKDTIKCIESYCDLTVIRQKENLGTIKDYFSKFLINAGDGSNEHPTQALIDLYTMKEYYNNLDNKVITIVGDLKYSRTVHSLLKILELFSVSIKLVTIEELQISRENVNNKDVEFYSLESLESVIKFTDILYVTRIQKERFNDDTIFNKVKKSYIIDNNVIKDSKENLIILHPLPRNEELSCDLDGCKKAKYFNQMKNGLYVRMGLLKYMFSKCV